MVSCITPVFRALDHHKITLIISSAGVLSLMFHSTRFRRLPLTIDSLETSSEERSYLIPSAQNSIVQIHHPNLNNFCQS
ncbi:unnamed protein product [Urochloa humidicola]